MKISDKAKNTIIRLIVYVIFPVVFWGLVFVTAQSCLDRCSRHEANEHDKPAKIEQNIPSPPRSMASYRLSKGD